MLLQSFASVKPCFTLWRFARRSSRDGSVSIERLREAMSAWTLCIRALLCIYTEALGMKNVHIIIICSPSHPWNLASLCGHSQEGRHWQEMAASALKPADIVILAHLRQLPAAALWLDTTKCTNAVLRIRETLLPFLAIRKKVVKRWQRQPWTLARGHACQHPIISIRALLCMYTEKALGTKTFTNNIGCGLWSQIVEHMRLMPGYSFQWWDGYQTNIGCG